MFQAVESLICIHCLLEGAESDWAPRWIKKRAIVHAIIGDEFATVQAKMHDKKLNGCCEKLFFGYARPYREKVTFSRRIQVVLSDKPKSTRKWG